MLAQTDDYRYREIDRASWSETVDGQEYIEKSQEEEVMEATQDALPQEVNTNWLTILAYVALVAVLTALILILLRSRLRGAGLKARSVGSGGLVDLDERPMESDLERHLREALERKDWRLAFRIQYLMVIKALHDRGRIRWKKEKTNHDYVREVADTPFFPSFREKSLLFDRVWYGLEPMGEADYRQQQSSIHSLIQQISQQ